MKLEYRGSYSCICYCHHHTPYTICSINDTQCKLLGDIEMKRLFKCLGLFVGWLQGGLYDFSSLPVSFLKHLNHEDLDTVMKLHSKYSCK